MRLHIFALYITDNQFSP